MCISVCSWSWSWSWWSAGDLAPVVAGVRAEVPARAGRGAAHAIARTLARALAPPNHSRGAQRALRLVAAARLGQLRHGHLTARRE